jgi:hypothetical protein
MSINHGIIKAASMKSIVVSFIRRVLNDQRGQVLPYVALGMVGMLGVGGLATDVGRAYVVQSQLQAYANAAALAAAGNVYNTATTNSATTVANSYSASSGDENANSYLGTVNTAVSPECLNMLMPAGSSCLTGSPANAVQVTESVSVNTFFMKMFGKPTLNVQATATASMQGIAEQWNVAIIEDATGSMATADSNCGGISEFQCALNGIQALLASTNPCPPGQSLCAPSAANLRVALFTFPNIMTQYLPAFNACTAMTFTGPAVPYNVYTLPVPGATSYKPLDYQEWSDSYTWSASYEVTYGASDADTNGFVSDYYLPSSTSTGGLNSSSSIVEAVGYGASASGHKQGCMAISPGGIALNGILGTPTPTSKVNTADVGEGITYYASVIYAAQSALTAESTLYPGSKNAMILLSDGQANTQWFYFPQGSIWQWPSANTVAPSTIVSGYSEYDTLKTTPNLNALGAAYLSTPNQEATGTISGLYPDFFDECQQAIVAGQAAATAGTRVFAVAYGAEQTGCASGSADSHTDVTLVATGKNQSFTLATLTPCVTMENIASSLDYFYSDYLQSGGGASTTCTDNSHSVTSLVDIFSSIAATFTKPRLLPNNAT